jgi:hypothetical protein
MSRDYTPLKKNYSLFFERRAACLSRKLEKQKWEDSRQKVSRKTRTKNHSTLEAMRSVINTEHRKNKGRPVSINSRHLSSRIPPVQDWKYLDERNKIFFYQLALERAEATGKGLKLTPFIFNASNTLTEAFYSQKKKLGDFLRDSFTESLTEALGRPIEFYFVIETAGMGKLHLQGSMLIAKHEQAPVRQALEKVNRKMTVSEKQHFLAFRLDRRKEIIDSHGNLYATLNWANYNIKEYRLNRIAYSLKTLTASSAPMTLLAKKYHAYFRQLKKAQQTTTYPEIYS